MSYKESNRPPYVEPSGSFHYGNEPLEQAEYSAEMGRYNKARKKRGLIARILLFFGIGPRVRDT